MSNLAKAALLWLIVQYQYLGKVRNSFYPAKLDDLNLGRQIYICS